MLAFRTIRPPFQKTLADLYAVYQTIQKTADDKPYRENQQDRYDRNYLHEFPGLKFATPRGLASGLRILRIPKEVLLWSIRRVNAPRCRNTLRKSIIYFSNGVPRIPRGQRKYPLDSSLFYVPRVNPWSIK